MRVKVGETWYDSTEVSIGVEFNRHEQQRIADWDWSTCPNGRYTQFPVAQTDYYGPEEDGE